MLDCMLISGRTGLLALPFAKSARLYRADGSEAGAVSHNELRRILARADDVIELKGRNLGEGLRVLAGERAKDRALVSLLTLLDPEEDEDIAGLAATRLEHFLEREEVRPFLEARLYSAPLPDASETRRMIRHLAGRPLLRAFGFELLNAQTRIALVREAFDQAAAPACLSADSFERIVELASDAGLFVRLAKGYYDNREIVVSMLSGSENVAILEGLVARWAHGVATRTAAASRNDDDPWLLNLPMGGTFDEEGEAIGTILPPEPVDEPIAPVLVPRRNLAAAATSVHHPGPAYASAPAKPVTISMQLLIEAGAHFGHQTHRWNPRMRPYIFGARNGIHLLDLSQTVPLFARALEFIHSTVAAGGKLLLVGTKRQAQDSIANAARVSGQYYVNHRWRTGLLTKWTTISNSIKRLKELEEQLSGDTWGLTRKEVLNKTRERDKLERSLGGVRDMERLPDVMFVIDANKEERAIREANVLGIPVIAILDSNVSPDGVAFPIPANDDAARAIRLYCDAVAWAAIAWSHSSTDEAGAASMTIAQIEVGYDIEAGPAADGDDVGIESEIEHD